MTAQKHLKKLVRARMGKTGESYTTARRQVLRQADPSQPRRDPSHFPGSIPASAALRTLLAHAGVRNPRTDAPFSEAMTFGIAGGIGAGVFAFHYAKEDFSSFYVAGRHLWQDYLSWTKAALKRFGHNPVIKESSGMRPAEKQLRELLDGGRPVLAWIDAATLPYYAMPAFWRGGGYHLVTIHGIDAAGGTALIGDLADELIPLALPELAAARARIKSFKNRLLAVEPGGKTPELAHLVRAGIRACVDGLVTCKKKNFTLEAFATWAERLDGSRTADSWEKIFTPGSKLYQGLWSVTEFIEHGGTGGGLCRPMFAEFLGEASELLGDRRLGELAARYAELGTGWSALANAALPDSVPALQATKALFARKAELFHSEGAGATAEIAACWNELGELGRRMKTDFPLDEAQSRTLRRDLQKRVRALYDGEVAALRELGEWGQ